MHCSGRLIRGSEDLMTKSLCVCLFQAQESESEGRKNGTREEEEDEIVSDDSDD